MSAEAYTANSDFLWKLCYRMTGNTADADDIVQETFVRVLEKPPRRMDQPLRPWLVRVALNLSRDLLRRRRRTYVGPWLPSPLPTDDAGNPPSYEPRAGDDESPLSRYDMLESVSFAFLLSLEALTPTQRAVLLLRDVFDYTTDETSRALGMKETNVKVTLHRARRAMRDYDERRASQRSGPLREKTRRALERFLACLTARDAKSLEQLLAADVVEMSDGGGEVAAARAPIIGRNKVLRLILGLSQKFARPPRPSFCLLNGMPAIMFELDDQPPGFASRFTMQCEVDDAGRIRRLGFVLAPRKLSAVRSER